LLAIAALVIDLGYVTLTRVQMQSAADSAALEGLRWRDEAPPQPAQVCPFDDPGALSADELRDFSRREAARELVCLSFSDPNDVNYLDPQNGRQPGAGPVVTLTGGETAFNAFQTASLPTSLHVYRPLLQRNQDNAVYGDLVSGTAGAGAPFDPSCPVANNTIQYREDCSYNRSDFLPAVPSAPGDPTASLQSPSFLVRLRRTSDFQTLDNDNQLTLSAGDSTGVSSSGPTMPLLFGQGSTIHLETDSTLNPNNYNPRFHGITVRATAITDARPALQVGLRQPGIPGVAPFALERSAWQSTAQPINLDGLSGYYLGVAADVIHSQATVGYVPVLQACQGGSSAGLTDFVPIVDGTLNRVIGFGLAAWSIDCAAGQVTVTPSITLQQAVAPRNATASMANIGPALAGLTVSEINAVMTANRSLLGAAMIPTVLAPAVVR
jgi:hypothetical protein